MFLLGTVRHANMKMMLMKEEVCTQRCWKTGGMSEHAGPPGGAPGWVRRRRDQREKSGQGRPPRLTARLVWIILLDSGAWWFSMAVWDLVLGYSVWMDVGLDNGDHSEKWALVSPRSARPRMLKCPEIHKVKKSR